MKFILIISLITLSNLQASAQLLPQYYDTLQHNQEFILSGGLEYSSSSINTDMLSTFTRGGFIDESMKLASFDKHKAINRLGLIGLSEFEYRNYTKKIFKNKPWGFVVKGGYNVFGGLLYAKDLYGLAFYGNERYLGDTMDMSGSRAAFISYQKVGFGFIHPSSKSSVTFNVYNISDKIAGNFHTLEIMQDANGDSVTVIADGDVQLKDNLKFNQGIGFGFDFDFKFVIDWQNEKQAHIQFLARDIGVSYMYEDQLSYSIDTTILYTGLEFSQIVGDNSLFSDNVDLLDTLGVRETTKNSLSLLPGFIQVAKIVDNQQITKLQSFFGVRLYSTLVYSPMVFLGLDYRPLDWLNVGASVSFGGLSGFKTGLYASGKKDKWSLGLGTENIIGFVSKRGNGQSVYLRLGCVI